MAVKNKSCLILTMVQDCKIALPVLIICFLKVAISEGLNRPLAEFSSSGDDDATRTMFWKETRVSAKPWLMRNIEIFGTEWPVSMASIIIVLLVLVNLRWNPGKTISAEASHILIKNHGQATKRRMEDMKKHIGSDLKRFSEHAAKYSQCPSREKGGDLGSFKQGDMAPPFDRAVFDPSSPLSTTIGPVETGFGYHLIYIRQRKIV